MVRLHNGHHRIGEGTMWVAVGRTGVRTCLLVLATYREVHDKAIGVNQAEENHKLIAGMPGLLNSCYKARTAYQ